MTSANGPFEALSHQLRFLLFETGIGLSQNSVDAYIKQARQQCLHTLQHQTFSKELINTLHDSIAHQALRLAYKHHWQQRLKKETQAFDHFWQGLTATKSPTEIMILLEQWRHPDQALTQQIPFSYREFMQYTPGFNPKVSLHAVAVKRTLARSSSNYQSLIETHFPKDHAVWEEKLRLRHLDPKQYYLLPMHPWHWRNHVLKQNPGLLDDQTLVLIPHQLTMFPTRSYDCLMPTTLEGCPIKLSANTHQDTSLSEKAHQIINEAGHYHDSLYLASTKATIRFQPMDFTQDQQLLFAELQEHPGQFLNTDEIAVPLTTLFSQSPREDSPLLCDIIASSGQNPIDFFNMYCQILLSGQMQLMSKHRLIIKSAPENTLLVFKQNNVKKIIFREPNIKSGHLEALQKQFVHTHLKNNLDLWIKLLNEQYQIDSKTLWAEVDTRLKNFVYETTRTLPENKHFMSLCPPLQGLK